jgi:hypothetical protein
MRVRCKFKCVEVTKREGWNGAEFVYEAKFNIAHGDSPENKQFFAATPGGNLSITTLRLDTFEVGKHYYVDLVPEAQEAIA